MNNLAIKNDCISTSYCSVGGKYHIITVVCVVVQFYPWLKFYLFIIFLGIAMYDNEFETKELKFEPRIKLNHNICNELFVPG